MFPFYEWELGSFKFDCKFATENNFEDCILAIIARISRQ